MSRPFLANREFGNQEEPLIEQDRTQEPTAAPPAWPGKKQGETDELTTFWRVNVGHEAQLHAVTTSAAP